MNRSDFIARNFTNTGRLPDGARGGNPNDRTPGVRGPGGPDGRGPGGRGPDGRGPDGRGDRGDWNRGDGGRGDWNRGNWNRGDWANNNWNNNNWNAWRGNNWNNWNHWGGKNWNGNWNGNWNRHWNNNWWWGGNRGWYGYGRNWNNWYNPGWYYPNYSWLGWGFGVPFIGWGLNYGLGYGGWGGYGLGYDYYYPYTTGYAYTYPTTTTLYADAGDTVVQLPSDATVAPAVADGDFITLGEEAFRAGQYDVALKRWQHAMVDNPDNGAVVLLMGQAMFALGQWEAAANTVQMAMQMLPDSEWGNVVVNYTQIYGNIEDYTNQLRAAEKARDAAPNDGAIRFLLGYHFGYLNYPKQAVRELDKALDIEPRDVGSQKLRDIFAKQGGIPARAPAAQPAAAPALIPPTSPAGANPPASAAALGTEA